MWGVACTLRSCPLTCRLAGNAEEVLRARLAQREQRLAELSATVAALHSRAAEERDVSSREAEEQCCQMLSASQKAEPFLRYVSEGDAVSFPKAQAAAPGNPVVHAEFQSASGKGGGDTVEPSGMRRQSGGDCAPQEQESEHERRIETSAAEELAPDRGHATAVSCSMTEAAAAPGSSRRQLPNNEGPQLPESASSGAVKPSLSENSSSHRMGVSMCTLQLAEEAEDLRLELAQRTAEAQGLQARLEHLTACQEEHEQSYASQAAQLATQAKVSGSCILCACSLSLGG